MYSKKDIPDLDRAGKLGLYRWWIRMLSIGLFIHPDDEPAEIIDVVTQRKVFDSGAAEKISSIFNEMFDKFEESLVYDSGMAAFYRYNGFHWDKEREEYLIGKN
ncbi:MAG: hypothetical protein KDK41_06955 [Leptospiraceae bacterium]|nr:hypothetical protein [Leptospiraceae bacterium]